MGRVHDDEVETKSRVALRTRWRSVALILHDANVQSEWFAEHVSWDLQAARRSWSCRGLPMRLRGEGGSAGVAEAWRAP
jgi:hypothetical protein